MRRDIMHYENTTFVYHIDFNEYMKVEGAASEDAFDYLFDVGVKTFLSIDFCMIYIKTGI